MSLTQTMTPLNNNPKKWELPWKCHALEGKGAA